MKKLVTLLATGAALALLCVQAATAGTTQISGKQIWTANPAVSIMTGSLVGTWTDTTEVPDVRFHPSGVIQASGTEEFEGCLGDVCGKLYFEYHAEIRVDSAFSLVRGRCWHRVTGGEDDFVGATGLITFKDDPANGCSEYKGHITVPDPS